MADKYKTKSTSSITLTVEDRELSRTSLTRRVIRPIIVENHNNQAASVKVSILHQKAISSNQFEDLEAEPLTTMKARDIGRLNLDTAETKKLFVELQNLYAIYDAKGVTRGSSELVVGREDEVVLTDPKRASLIRQLIGKGHSEELWKQLVESDPDLATKLCLARVQQNRQAALKEFSQALGSQGKSEPYWQSFFERNSWIFGYGLNYQILKTVTSQAHLGGQTVYGGGTNKGDFLKATQGKAKFTVLVEIKRADTPLLESKPYRNDAYSPHPEISGGLSQLRTNARRWEVEGSQTRKNVDALEGQNIFTLRPKMLLIAGHCNQLTGRAKRESFQLFRQGQSDVEVLTFDEIFERAKFIVEHSDHVPPGSG